jgi:ABC-type Na+ transport system ATPase subunit NatA
VRLIEIISSFISSEKSKITISVCPQDEGAARNRGQIGAALAPEGFHRQFHKLPNFKFSAEIFDLGDKILQKTCRYRLHKFC